MIFYITITIKINKHYTPENEIQCSISFLGKKVPYLNLTLAFETQI
jgi:hypothetical protein